MKPFLKTSFLLAAPALFFGIFYLEKDIGYARLLLLMKVLLLGGFLYSLYKHFLKFIKEHGLKRLFYALLFASAVVLMGLVFHFSTEIVLLKDIQFFRNHENRFQELIPWADSSCDAQSMRCALPDTPAWIGTHSPFFVWRDSQGAIELIGVNARGGMQFTYAPKYPTESQYTGGTSITCPYELGDDWFLCRFSTN